MIQVNSVILNPFHVFLICQNCKFCVLDEAAPSNPPLGNPRTLETQPVSVPAITLDEIKEITENFGNKALIGDGSFGKVYHGVLRNGVVAAIKKLDSSTQADQEFLSQVGC